MSKIRYTNISQLYGIDENPSSLKKGKDLSILNSLENAYLTCENGVIIDYGSMDDLDGHADEDVDCQGNLVLPAWCDSHTHIVFAESRQAEFRMRILGKSYEEIAENGGGILNSALKLQTKSESELYDSAAQRVDELIRFGVGALEVKSGYGLTAESEYKMLRVIRSLKENFDMPIKSTFLGAHAIPLEFKNNREAYIRLIIDEMLPYVAGEGLADYCDVFCDKGFFTVDETREILTAAETFGLRAKIHANELAVSGGVQIAHEMNALSCDHLEAITQVEIDLLKESDTIPTVLPGTSFYLNIPYAPAREMIDNGLAVCLASDYNPGSTPSGNIPLLLSLACIKMKMTPEEAVNAMTINGACAMELERELGTISIGKKSHFIITKNIQHIAEIMYYYGGDCIGNVVIGDKKY